MHESLPIPCYSADSHDSTVLRSTAPSSRFERNRHKALELFAQKGFGQVSMRELAMHLGITAGSLYNHFASKEELLFEFIEEHYEAVLALFSRLPRGAAPEVSLTTLLRALLELYDQRPMHFRLAARDLNCIDLGHQARIETLRQASRQRLLQLLGYPPSTSTPLQQAAAVASMNLLELLPASLDKCPLPAKQRTALLEHLIIGAVTHTLKLLRSDSVPAQLHTR